MEKPDEVVSDAKEVMEEAKSFADSFLNVSLPTSEISDTDLQGQDTANMIKHGVLYTKLLDIYVADIMVTLKEKRKRKEEFYDICAFLLMSTGIMFFTFILLMVLKLIPADSVAIPMSVIVSFLTVFIVIPHTIATYLFNTEEEKYMTDIIKSVQEHDVEIRRGMGENNK